MLLRNAIDSNHLFSALDLFLLKNGRKILTLAASQRFDGKNFWRESTTSEREFTLVIGADKHKFSLQENGKLVLSSTTDARLHGSKLEFDNLEEVEMNLFSSTAILSDAGSFEVKNTLLHKFFEHISSGIREFYSNNKALKVFNGKLVLIPSTPSTIEGIDLPQLFFSFPKTDEPLVQAFQNLFSSYGEFKDRQRDVGYGITLWGQFYQENPKLFCFNTLEAAVAFYNDLEQIKAEVHDYAQQLEMAHLQTDKIYKEMEKHLAPYKGRFLEIKCRAIKYSLQDKFYSIEVPTIVLNKTAESLTELKKALDANFFVQDPQECDFIIKDIHITPVNVILERIVNLSFKLERLSAMEEYEVVRPEATTAKISTEYKVMNSANSAKNKTEYEFSLAPRNLVAELSSQMSTPSSRPTSQNTEDEYRPSPTRK